MACRLTWIALLGACSFSAPVENGEPGSAPPNLPDPSDPVDPCIVGYLDLCSQTAPTEPLNIEVSEAIDTDRDPRCRTVAQTNGRPICLLYATEVTIGVDATLRATGSRPLAIASTSTMSIAGTIDVSSQRSTGQIGPGADDTCAFTQTPQSDPGGGGGAAGGTFATLGGNGGTGDRDNNIGNDGIAMPGVRGSAMGILVLRGGCRGQRGGHEWVYGGYGGHGGRGGHGGGALYLHAKELIESSGTIRATGAGGEGGDAQAGGGGGGSGGQVVIESAVIRISGRISANGGGGGEGGGKVSAGPASVELAGNPGSDGTLDLEPAAGGSSTNTTLGPGGAGGAGTTSATDGSTSEVGGGGGGGSVGVIALIGTREITGVLSPPPQ